MALKNPAHEAEANLRVTAARLRDTYRVEYDRYVRNMVAGDDDKQFPSCGVKPGPVEHVTPVENPEAIVVNGRVVPKSEMDWLEAARTALELRVDPEDYVRRQFARTSPPANPPSPTRLFTAVALRRYHESFVPDPMPARSALQSQTKTFGIETAKLVRAVIDPVPLERAWSEAVTNEDDRRLSALFRYCTALSLAADRRVSDHAHFAAVADRYRVAAAVQYVLNADAYDLAWRTFLPPGWRAQALKLYRDFYGLNYELESR